MWALARGPPPPPLRYEHAHRFNRFFKASLIRPPIWLIRPPIILIRPPMIVIRPLIKLIRPLVELIRPPIRLIIPLITSNWHWHWHWQWQHYHWRKSGILRGQSIMAKLMDLLITKTYHWGFVVYLLVNAWTRSLTRWYKYTENPEKEEQVIN